MTNHTLYIYTADNIPEHISRQDGKSGQYFVRELDRAQVLQNRELATHRNQGKEEKHKQMLEHLLAPVGTKSCETQSSCFYFTRNPTK